MIRYFVILGICLTVIGCTKSTIHELKSPCVAIENEQDLSATSPCVRRRPESNRIV